MVKVFHFSDIHYVSSSVGEHISHISLKRCFGLINQHFMGRSKALGGSSRESVLKALEHRVHLSKQEGTPSICIFTGDATSMSLPSEFIAARDAMKPLLHSTQSIAIKGNHDVYTLTQSKTNAFEHHFKSFQLPFVNGLGTLSTAELDIVSVETCRPRLFDSSGCVPEEQLKSLELFLSHPSEKPLLLLMHYPIVAASVHPLGVVSTGYHLKSPSHAIENGHILMKVLERSIRRPSMILHGHLHRQSVSLWNDTVVANPGSAADRFHASFNVYDVNGSNVHIEMYKWDQHLNTFSEKIVQFDQSH